MSNLRAMLSNMTGQLSFIGEISVFSLKVGEMFCT